MRDDECEMVRPIWIISHVLGQPELECLKNQTRTNQTKVMSTSSVFKLVIQGKLVIYLFLKIYWVWRDGLVAKRT